MSWDSYVKQLCTAPNDKKYVGYAAIWGIEGDPSVWASNGCLTGITTEEVRRLAGNSCTFYQDNPKIMGQKFMMLRDEREDQCNRCMFLKRKGMGAMCIGQTKKVMLICHAAEGSNVGSISPSLLPILKYLEKNGF